MAKQVNVREAKTQLPTLIERVSAGEEIVIAKGGKPVARLAPLAPRARPRTLGLLKGKIWIAKDFNAPLPAEVLDSFEGGGARKSRPKARKR